VHLYNIQAEPVANAVALYDYEAVGEGEISVKEDDALHVYDKDNEWWLAIAHGATDKIGYVPGNYLEERHDPVSAQLIRMFYD
jgi:actin cytoskeleton-regulatory complex protein SLA1